MFKNWSGNTLVIAATALLLFGLSPTAAHATVSAYQISSPSVLLSGDYADGQVDDYMLENDSVAVLIAESFLCRVLQIRASADRAVNGITVKLEIEGLAPR